MKSCQCELHGARSNPQRHDRRAGASCDCSPRILRVKNALASSSEAGASAGLLPPCELGCPAAAPRELGGRLPRPAAKLEQGSAIARVMVRARCHRCRHSFLLIAAVRATGSLSAAAVRPSPVRAAAAPRRCHFFSTRVPVQFLRGSPIVCCCCATHFHYTHKFQRGACNGREYRTQPTRAAAATH